MDKVAAAFLDDAWSKQFEFVAWFAALICNIMQWGCGCSCHHEALMRGEKVDCWMKGRRLKEAHKYTMGCLDQAVAEANMSGQSRFDCGEEF